MIFNQLYAFFRCDADPQALAKYVVALVKKDKSESNLQTMCKEQLDVFLQKGTASKLLKYDKIAIYCSYGCQYMHISVHNGFRVMV